MNFLVKRWHEISYFMSNVNLFLQIALAHSSLNEILHGMLKLIEWFLFFLSRMHIVYGNLQLFHNEEASSIFPFLFKDLVNYWIWKKNKLKNLWVEEFFLDDYVCYFFSIILNTHQCSFPEIEFLHSLSSHSSPTSICRSTFFYISKTMFNWILHISWELFYFAIFDAMQ